MAKLLGRAVIKVDGAELLSKEGAKLNVGGVQRVTVVGNKVHGYAEKVVPASIECAISVDGRTNLSQLAKMENVTVLFACDTGQQFVLRNAWLTDPPEMTAGEGGGDVALKFEAVSCEELTS